MIHNEPSAALIDYLQHPEISEQLFDYLPDVVFFIKDSNACYIAVNQTFVLRSGVKNKEDVIGLTSVDLLGEDMGQRYVDQDKQVMKSGQPLVRCLELHNYQSQEIGWCLTTKLPIFDQKGNCTGLIGVSQDLKWPEITNTMFNNIYTAVRFAEEQLEHNPTIGQIADIAKMSPYQLDRRMKLVFGLTTGKWLLKTRITKASKQLLETDLAILEIAFSVGYSDQSAFTRQFKKATGLTPSEFKKVNRTTKYP